MNKRRIWATSPVYYVMAAVMFIMACFSYTQNKILFAVEITVSGLCLAAVIMTDLHYRVHVYTALRAARKVLSADEQRNLGQFALPLAVLGSAGDIVWTNERFQELFTENGEGCGDNIAAYIYPEDFASDFIRKRNLRFLRRPRVYGLRPAHRKRQCALLCGRHVL